MSAWADYSATDTHQEHTGLSCLDGDLVARAVIDGLLKLRPAFLEDPGTENVVNLPLGERMKVCATKLPLVSS